MREGQGEGRIIQTRQREGKAKGGGTTQIQKKSEKKKAALY